MNFEVPDKYDPLMMAFDGKISWSEALEIDDNTSIHGPYKESWWRWWRIVPDTYCGWEVQQWTVIWPFWAQYKTNSHKTIENAKTYILRKVL